MRCLKTVMPDKYSEKNLVSAVIGVINDYVPISSGRSSTAIEEQVFWSKFENFENTFCDAYSYPIMVSIGTCKAFYFWGLTTDSKANLLFCEKNSSTIDCKFLPSPCKNVDLYAVKRPIIALCDSFSRACCQWQVRFVSLTDNKPVQTLYFESRSLSVDGNSRFVLIARVDCITVLSATSFAECFTITLAKPQINPNIHPRNSPFSMGVRWLAFADSKPVYHHISRCGDASSLESQPLTSTVMNMNKRIWSSISALANTVVSPGNQAASLGQLPDSAHQNQGQDILEQNRITKDNSKDESNVSSGYVTIVDLPTLYRHYEDLKQLESSAATVCLGGTVSSEPVDAFPSQLSSGSKLCGTAYINVHDHCESGSVVAHFMAHRWANVSLLKFDSTGSLLFTACTRGHAFNIFRISNHPYDERQTSVHHLYILERGTIPCDVLDATFSNDSRWIAVSTNHGTTHVFPITPYGGLITVRTHTRPHVVNRTSRYHRSSGLEEHHLTRPQRERIASDVCHPQVSGDDATKQQISSVSSATFCHGAPIAGLSPHCPHLGFSSGASATFPSRVHSGSTEHLSANTRTSHTASCPESVTLPSYIEGACACPLNAMYNTVNPRLPPYPEPCVIKPEARLRPHNPGNSTTGAAAAALGGALEAVTSSTVPSGNRTPSMSYPVSPSSLPHPGPCVHNPLLDQSPPRPYYSPRQPLPVADPYFDSQGWPPVRPTMAARFAPPICFLPTRPRQTTTLVTKKRDPYGGNSRAVDGLFILAADLHLIEYDLNVLPMESAYLGDKFYQDGSIRLDCIPVAEWNLRTHATYLPPFPQSHPFSMASVNRDPKTSKLKQVPASSSCAIENPDSEISQNVAIQSKELSSEDAESYWYSQVEVTTHLGPLRRVWMGPQFTFRSYSKVLSHDDSSVQFCVGSEETKLKIPAGVEFLKSSKLHEILTPCTEPTEMTIFYRSPRQPDSDWPDCIGGTPSNFSPRSSPSSTTLQLAEAAEAYFPLRPKQTAIRTPVKRLIDTGSTPNVARWRNRSGEMARPINIPGSHASLSNTPDLSIYIEGGSYQDSSLGGSLSSLVGRGGDDVASCIAEAIQDEDIFWNVEKNPCDSSVTNTHAGMPSYPAISKPIEEYHCSITGFAASALRSALSEADFPSQDVSPILLPSPVADYVGQNEAIASSKQSTDELEKIQIPAEHTEGSSTPVAPQPVRLSSKRAKRSKKNHKASKQTAKSAGQVTPAVAVNEQSVTLSTNVVSGYDSLSCSPAVSTRGLERSHSVDSFDCPQTNVDGSEEIAPIEGDELCADGATTRHFVPEDSANVESD